MDLRQLTYFAAVAEERNLGRAAARLCLSQPPLTRHIKSLEAELGVALFVRTPRGMLLTQAGEQLLQDAQHIFGMLGQAADRAQRAAAGLLGRLDVGVYGSAVFGVVPRVLAAFARAHPDVEVALHYAQTPAQVQALRQGRVLIVFERLLPNEPDIEVEPVAREALLVALPESHPLAARRSIDMKSLRDQTLIVGSSPVATARAIELCRAHGFEPQLAPSASDLVMATLRAAIGAGVVLVPESMASVRFPGIAYRPLKAGAQATMDVHCFYRRGERSPLLQAMLETVKTFRAAACAAPPTDPKKD